MKRWTKTVYFMLCLLVLGISACRENTSANKTTDLNVTITETVKPILPPNCPVILTTGHLPVTKWRENPLLVIRLTTNQNYDSSLGDACQGDMKNLWPDLLRLESELESYEPYIDGIRGISENIEYFPETFNEVKNHVNSAATEYALNESMDKIDRSTPYGKNAVASKLYEFLNTSLNDYWLSDHGPIIENLLSNHDVKLRFYGQEKAQFCYHRFEYCYCHLYDSDRGDRCVNASREDRKASSGKYDFEFFPAGPYGGITFHTPEWFNPKSLRADP